jgi:biotin carboxylase
MARVALLLPTTTYRATDFVTAASRLGVEVVVACDQRQALADAMPERAVVVDFRDLDGAATVLAELHHRKPIDAVVAVDEAGVRLAAVIGERLGLRHNPPAAAAATRDKAVLRETLAAAATGVRQPAFVVVRHGDDVGRAAAEVGLPCVVKPVVLSGSRGVIRADTVEAAVEAGHRARRILATAGEAADGPLLVERFVAGREVALEGLLVDGSLRVLAVFDKPDPLDGPYFEETMLVTPSRIAPTGTAVGDRLVSVVTDVVRAIGLREGPVHAEARVADDGTVWFLEIAARSIGGLCSRTLSFGVGMSLEEILLRHAIGRLPTHEWHRERAATGALMLPVTVGGVLDAISGWDRALSEPGIVGGEITIPVGQTIVPLPEGDRYLGFLFARGETPDAVEASLRRAQAHLEVVVGGGATGPVGVAQ